MRTTLMTMLAAFVGVAGFTAAGGGPRALAAPPAAPRPVKDVLVRGKKVLGDALLAALPTPTAGGPVPLAVFVVDGTPHTRKGAADLARAVEDLVRDGGPVAAWRIAALGDKLTPVRRGPAAAAADVRRALAGDTPEVNTVAALLRTLAPLRESAAVVYLADWRFEDDQGLEEAIGRLRERRQSLSVVGTEAAFLRGWSDGTPPPLHRSSPRGFLDVMPGVSQHPFGPGKPDAAWHGGETAFPPQPYRWHGFLWATEFDASAGRSVLDVVPKRPQDGPVAPGDVEDLLERFGKTAPDDLDGRTFPLPSAFGPYGLSRFAAETGGRYVLWSWNPSGRARVTYEWGRCDYFPPDLRSRKDLLAGLASDPHASAMLRAWHLLLHEAPGLVEHLPPVDAALKGPRAVAEAPAGNSMPWTWDRLGELKEFLRGADAGLAGSTRALALLDPLADVAAEPDDDRARRGLAELRLFRHTLRTIAFELAEARTAARGVPPDAFAKLRRDTSLGCGSRELLVGKGSVLSRLGGVVTRSATPPYDAAAFARVKAEREALAARYRGTPFAELVLFNDVSTFRVDVWTRGTPPDTSGLPAESDSPPPATPPPSGGSTGGGGPSTGR